MENKIRMIAADLDRTLLRDNETLSAATVEAILRARKKGILFVIATARSPYSAMLVARDLCPDAVIHTGGAYAVVGGKTVYRAVLSPDDTRDAVLTCLSAPCVDHVRINGETEDITTNPAIPKGAFEFGHYRRVFPEQFPQRLTQAASKITVCTREPDRIAALFAGDGRYLFTPSRNTGSFGHKLAHPAATKEAALPHIAAYFGVGLDEIAAFGDDMADLGMLSICGGVAVANAVPEVKAAADTVCGSNEEDGVADYINKTFI